MEWEREREGAVNRDPSTSASKLLGSELCTTRHKETFFLRKLYWFSVKRERLKAIETLTGLIKNKTKQNTHLWSRHTGFGVGWFRWVFVVAVNLVFTLKDIYLQMHPVHSVPIEARRGRQTWNWRERQSWASRWVSGTKPRSSGTAETPHQASIVRIFGERIKLFVKVHST